MPGVFQLSVEEAVREAESAMRSGVHAVILFGIPKEKDPIGLENFAENGIIQQAIHAIKKEIPEMVVITDVCLCEYTDHGHCGILNTGEHFQSLSEGYVPMTDVGCTCQLQSRHADWCGYRRAQDDD
jgi:porphobilinogen synthase